MGKDLIRRPATLGDEAALVELLRQSHASAGFPFAFAPDAARDLVHRTWGSPDGFLRVIDRDGDPVGMLIGAAADHHFGFRVASEVVWWVSAEARGKRASVGLLADFEEWARNRGCAYCGMAALASGDGPRAEALYSRLGYAPLERHFFKRLI